MTSATTGSEKKRSFFDPAPPPVSKLGCYRLLSPTCGLRVSPLCLGAMNFGDAWTGFMGECSKETTFSILDYFYQQGGNFIDTANNYQNEQSEQWIGEWLTKTGHRDEMVIATKFSSPFKHGSEPHKLQVNFTGNSKKSLHTSVENSLKNLQTSYIDILYVHWWDYTTPIEEVMTSLHHLVASGKVLYLGVSDTPAWVVSQANQFAKDHALTQFVVYQGRWSIGNRDFERDILPMCKQLGLGFAPWGALGGGLFKTDEEIAKLKEAGESSRMVYDIKAFERVRPLVKVLQKIANIKKTNTTSIALAYVMQKTPYVFPIVGGRKLEHLKGNIEALTNISLSDDEIKELEAASPIDLGFPHDFIGQSPAGNFILTRASHYDWVDAPKAIKYTH